MGAQSAKQSPAQAGVERTPGGGLRISGLFSPSVAECAAPPPPPPQMQMFTPVGDYSSGAAASTPLPPSDSSSPLPPLEPLAALPPPPPEAPPAQTITNPGGFDKADQEAKGVLMLDAFDGCRFELQKQMTNQFVVSHLVWLGSAMLPGGSMYQFGTQLQTTPYGKETLMLGRLSQDGSVEARLIHVPHPGVTAHVVGNFTEEEGRSQGRAELEWKGSDFTANATVANGFTLTGSYFQAVLPKVAVGGEAIVHTGRNLCVLGAKARYDDKVNKFVTGFSSIQGGMYSMSYMRQVNEHVALACDFEAVVANLESTMNCGWKYSLRPCTIQAMLNSKGQLQATVTENISMGFSVLFSAMLDHPNDTHKFGFGLQLMA